MYKYQEPIIKIIFFECSDVCTFSQDAEDPWGDSNWNNN